MAAKPTLNCCRVVSLPCNSCVYLLGAFLLGTAFLGQKASHFVPFGGMANGQRLENALQLLALAFGKVCRIQACLEAAGSNAEQVWGFFIGLRRGVQDVTAVWLTNPAQHNLFCLGRPRTSSCRTLSALGARLCGIPSPAGNSAKLIRAVLGNNEISRLIWPDSRTSTEASAPVGVA